MRSPILVILLLPAMEIGLLALFASRFGLASVAAEVLGTSLLGVLLLRRAGYRNLVALNARLQQPQEPPEKILRDLLGAVAGVLLVIPGIATDLVGLVLLLPGVRDRVARSWTSSGKVFRYQAGAGTPWEQAPPGPGVHRSSGAEAGRRPAGGDVIEGEFRREED